MRLTRTLAALAGATFLVAGAATAAVASTPTPAGSNAVGSLKLFDSSGNRVTSGAVDAMPFVARATADSGNVRDGDNRATLQVGTPVKGQDPQTWNLSPLSSATTYDPATENPTVRPGSTTRTLAQHIANFPNNATDDYAGLYQLRILPTQPGFSPTGLYFVATIKVTGNTWNQVAPDTTSTSLTTSPSGSAPTGTQVTLTAAVAPATAGSVQFFDGTTALGGPVAAPNGRASTTTTPAAGQHSYTARFTPTDFNNFYPSTSAAVPFQTTTTGPAPAVPEVRYALVLPVLAGVLGMSFFLVRRRRGTA